jgi:hypothetical protein
MDISDCFYVAWRANFLLFSGIYIICNMLYFPLYIITPVFGWLVNVLSFHTDEFKILLVWVYLEDP